MPGTKYAWHRNTSQPAEIPEELVDCHGHDVLALEDSGPSSCDVRASEGDHICKVPQRCKGLPRQLSSICTHWSKKFLSLMTSWMNVENTQMLLHGGWCVRASSAVKRRIGKSPSAHGGLATRDNSAATIFARANAKRRVTKKLALRDEDVDDSTHDTVKLMSREYLNR
eukprot:1969506-Amphidinium_carterae.1